jgi:hypothetical protein
MWENAPEFEEGEIVDGVSAVNDSEVSSDASREVTEGWKVILKELPRERLTKLKKSKRDSRDKLTVPIPGAVVANTGKPASRFWNDTLTAISETVGAGCLGTHGLLSVKSLDPSLKLYTPDVPLWTVAKGDVLPQGLTQPAHWNFTLSSRAVSELEIFAERAIHAAAYSDLLAEALGCIIDKGVLSLDDITSITKIQSALTVASRDQLMVAATSATNLRLLRREAVLKNVGLQEWNRRAAQQSSVVPDQVFGPEAAAAVDADRKDPMHIYRAMQRGGRGQRTSLSARPFRYRSKQPGRALDRLRNSWNEAYMQSTSGGQAYRRDYGTGRGGGRGANPRGRGQRPYRRTAPAATATSAAAAVTTTSQ